jgi:hypothetical protein
VAVNFWHLRNADHVEFALEEIAHLYAPHVAPAERGARSHAATAALAATLGVAPEALVRAHGGALVTEEALAGQRLLGIATTRVVDAARAAAAPGASVASVAAFRRLLATHAAIQAELRGDSAAADDALAAATAATRAWEPPTMLRRAA